MPPSADEAVTVVANPPDAVVATVTGTDTVGRVVPAATVPAA